MLKNNAIILISVFLILFTSVGFTEEYIFKLDTDDLISIRVYGEEELSIEEVKISSTGHVSMPLIGQVLLSGLTVQEAEEKIAKKYKDGYLKQPNISLSIIEYRLFYVDGAVENPGGYSYSKKMDVERAVALAGGITERGDKDTIVIKSSKDEKLKKKVPLDYIVTPGDIIFVPERFF